MEGGMNQHDKKIARLNRMMHMKEKRYRSLSTHQDIISTPVATTRLLAESNNSSSLSKVKMTSNRVKLIENLRTPFSNITNENISTPVATNRLLADSNKSSAFSQVIMTSKRVKLIDNFTIPFSDISNGGQLPSNTPSSIESDILTNIHTNGASSKYQLSQMRSARKHIIQNSRILRSLRFNNDTQNQLISVDGDISMDLNDSQNNYDLVQRDNITNTEGINPTIHCDENNTTLTIEDNWDIGDQNWCCEFCGALMWYDERVRKTYNARKPRFSLCCGQGKVAIPLMIHPPSLLSDLINNRHAKSKHFIENIRAYNMMFSFTSMGGKIDSSVNEGTGPYVYRLHGQNYHMLGSLVPQQGAAPKFAQLYIYDTDNEVSNRINSFR